MFSDGMGAAVIDVSDTYQVDIKQLAVESNMIPSHMPDTDDAHS